MRKCIWYFVFSSGKACVGPDQEKGPAWGLRSGRKTVGLFTRLQCSEPASKKKGLGLLTLGSTGPQVLIFVQTVQICTLVFVHTVFMYVARGKWPAIVYFGSDINYWTLSRVERRACFANLNKERIQPLLKSLTSQQ